jgi:acyl-CoA thioesterase-1
MTSAGMALLALIGLILATISPSALAQRPVVPRATPPDPFTPVEDVAGLPRVLLIGDSISMGYTVPVRKLLAGKANVHRIPENGGATKAGLAKIDAWLGAEKWDVIHFNWGLHNLMFDPASAPDPAQYEKDQLAFYETSLRTLVARLKQTGAKLIWASSTPVADEMGSSRSPSHRAATVKIYNEVAAKIMAENRIPIDDLYTYVEPVQDKMRKPHDVHFSEEGSEFLARKVAEEIANALPIQKAGQH